MVTIFAVVAVILVHREGLRKQIGQEIHRESSDFARHMSEQITQWLEADQASVLSSKLQLAQATTRFSVSFTGFHSDFVGLSPGFFELTPEECLQIQQGGEVSGSARGRLVHPAFEADQKFRGAFVAVPVIYGGKCVGAVVVYHLRPEVSRREEGENRGILNAVILALVSALTLSILLARSLTRPIRRVTNAAQRFATGDLSARTNLSRTDEVGLLATTFDTMASKIESSITNRSRLLSDVSHELGTPVTTIRATLEAMIDGVGITNDEHEHYLSSLLHQAEYLSSIVHDVTELSRFETGKIKIAQSVFSAETPVRHSLEAAQVLANGRSINLEVLESDESLEVVGDIQRISQVLTNLVVNAVHHNVDGTTVSLSWRKEKDRVSFEVHDDGERIPEDEQENIFERFYKLSHSRTRDGSGAGLGLAIVQEILISHGARLTLVQDDTGKSFRFSLKEAT